MPLLVVLAVHPSVFENEDSRADLRVRQDVEDQDHAC